jgi:type IV pilus assembly protein PilX
MNGFSGHGVNNQRGALLLATLIVLAALSLLGATALEAVLLEQRMAGNLSLRQDLLAAVEHGLEEVERQLQNAILAEDDAWLAGAAEGQALPLPAWNVAAVYRIVFCCETAWDASQPLSEANAARLYRIDVQATGTGTRARLALQGAYVVAPATAEARRVAWRHLD